MARCPHCHKILSDKWIIGQGASLMGKVGGKNKARTNAREAARARWKQKYDKKLD